MVSWIGSNPRKNDPSRTYVVYWPDSRVVKVGVGQRARWKKFMQTGAMLIDLIPDEDGTSPYDIETVVAQAFRKHCVEAFTCAEDAIGHLGGRGGGWCECYVMPPHLTPLRLLAEASWDGP